MRMFLRSRSLVSPTHPRRRGLMNMGHPPSSGKDLPPVLSCHPPVVSAVPARKQYSCVPAGVTRWLLLAFGDGVMCCPLVSLRVEEAPCC